MISVPEIQCLVMQAIILFRSEQTMSVVFWILGLFGLYVAIANISNKAVPALTMRCRWLAWLVLLTAVSVLFVALSLTMGDREATVQAKRLLANPPKSNYTEYSESLSELSGSVKGRLRRRLLVEMERIKPQVEMEGLLREAESLAVVDEGMSLSDLRRRVERLEEISGKLPNGAEKRECDRLTVEVKIAHDDRIMVVAAAKFGFQPEWDTDTSEIQNELRNIRKQLFLKANKDKIDDEITQISLRKDERIMAVAHAKFGFEPKWDTDISKIKNELQELKKQLFLEENKDKIDNEIVRIMLCKMDAQFKRNQEKLLQSPRLSYGDLLRKPEEFFWKYIRRQGRVVEDLSDLDGHQNYRVATGKNYWGTYTDDDMYIVLLNLCVAPEVRLVEGDIIDFVGTVQRPFSYYTVLGSRRTIPQVHVEWVEVIQPRG